MKGRKKKDFQEHLSRKIMQRTSYKSGKEMWKAEHCGYQCKNAGK